MLLQSINLSNFRNSESSFYNFGELLTVIIGPNSRGKTNLLEAVYTLINGEGFRESKEEELIKFNASQSILIGRLLTNGIAVEHKIAITKRNEIVEKHYFVNKTRKKLNQYLLTQTKAVLFTPEQIDLIIGAPGLRRGYFDKILSYYDFRYKKSIDNYENALRRRNKVFETNRTDRELVDELQFWNDYMIKQADHISNKRDEYCLFLNKHPSLDSKHFQIKYLKNEFNEQKLRDIFDEERKWKRTLIGPQKDDFQIILKGGDFDKNIHHFGSRSEQRIAVFWLKLNEINYYETEKNNKPILLLDDVFSELDSNNKKVILDLIKDYQTVLTTTEEEILRTIKVENTVIRL